MTILIQHLYICDVCHLCRVGGPYTYRLGEEPLRPGLGPDDDEWTMIGGRLVCPRHSVTTVTTIDGEVVRP